LVSSIKGWQEQLGDSTPVVLLLPSKEAFIKVALTTAKIR